MHLLTSAQIFPGPEALVVVQFAAGIVCMLCRIRLIHPLEALSYSANYYGFCFMRFFSGGSIWGKGILKSRLEATFQDHRL